MSIGFLVMYYGSSLLYCLVLWAVLRRMLKRVDEFPYRIWFWAMVGYPIVLLGYYTVINYFFLLWAGIGLGLYATNFLPKVIELILVICAVTLLGRWIAGHAASVHPLCPACKYDLTGLDRPRCPECGTHFEIETRYLTRRADFPRQAGAS